MSRVEMTEKEGRVVRHMVSVTHVIYKGGTGITISGIVNITRNFPNGKFRWKKE